MEAAREKRINGGQPSGITPVVVAAHELKSPLALIRQLLLDLDSTPADHRERQRLIDQMVQVSEKALRLTSDITKAETAQQALFELSPVNPLTVCEDVVTELERLYSLHNCSLKIGRQRHIPAVVANRDLLRRILLNFADNALHYADLDGVVELQAHLIRERQTVRLSVRDYGPHLPIGQWRNMLRSLGEQQPVHARPQSSGLGLYISHQFASAMNGRIGATRHRDGASFFVELPVSRQLSLL